MDYVAGKALIIIICPLNVGHVHSFTCFHDVFVPTAAVFHCQCLKMLLIVFVYFVMCACVRVCVLITVT